PGRWDMARWPSLAEGRGRIHAFAMKSLALRLAVSALAASSAAAGRAGAADAPNASQPAPDPSASPAPADAPAANTPAAQTPANGPSMPADYDASADADPAALADFHDALSPYG